MGDASPEILEAIDEAASLYGVVIRVGDRVAIARALARLPVGTLTGTRVARACVKQGLAGLPDGFGSAVVARVESLGGARRLKDVLTEYRTFAIDSLSAEFGAARSRGREESLRNNVRTYLTTHAEVEARTGRGKTDLYLPELDAVIEVKVWTDQATYLEGVEELGRYIHTKRPKEALMVVFGDRDPLPAIATSHREPFAEPLKLEGVTVQVIVVPFEGDAPSKALRKKKLRAKSGR